MKATVYRLGAALLLSGTVLGLAACGSGDLNQAAPSNVGSSVSGNGTMNGAPSGSYDGSNSATSAPR
jgi:hypothetical protein